MRKEDLERFAKPYPNNKTETDRRFNVAIGAEVPSAAVLTNELLADLSDAYGVTWWSSLETEERILIGDYLYQCLAGIETNLVEAHLHYLELRALRAGQNKRMEDSVSMVAGQPTPTLTAAKCALEELPDKLEGVHMSGLFRAVGSSLDCLGACIIIVLGLKAPLRRSDFNTAKRNLIELNKSNKASQLERDFLAFLETAINQAGPLDWLEWANEYRNLLVHRGRLIMVKEMLPASFDYRKGKTTIKTRVKSHLAKYPDRSDVEVWMENRYALIDEDADLTLKHLLISCGNLLETVCKELVSIWQLRKNAPTLIEQPVNQMGAKIEEAGLSWFYEEPALGLRYRTYLSSHV